VSTERTEDRILQALEQDAKASHAEIAERAGVSKPTVRKYIDRLESEGVITGYSADVDPKKLSEQAIALVGIEAESDRYVDVTRAVAELDAVETLYRSTGDHMLMAEVRAPDGAALGDVINEEIASIPGVTAAHPSFLQERIE
jgi:Lrp/AsnC family transcriptional regulator for asnA, asnC and gidA